MTFDPVKRDEFYIVMGKALEWLSNSMDNKERLVDSLEYIFKRNLTDREHEVIADYFTTEQ